MNTSMMTTRLSLALLALALCAPVVAQQIRTFTQTAGTPGALVYGLPVPLPIDSLTPVDGFRSHASLEARLQALAFESTDLAAHDIGRSSANRVQWAYVASDDDDVDIEGRPEAAFFINATTHAREWAAPEVAVGTLERLVAGADDRGVVRYLLDNTRVIVLPVHNVDGFLQTQRYPTQAIVGKDPDVPNEWPRDGRMRRKNMPGVDEVLTTFGDHLLGVDLNRNHPPLWATSVGQGGSSFNSNSLTYHGTAPHSEAENLSLEQAAALGPVTRLRLGIDLHTFSQLFYSSNTGRTRLNGVQNGMIARLGAHHLATAGKWYPDVPDPANRGIGAAAEYFAYEWLVPAWTLELEPSSSVAEYGGTNVTHGGFILPASEVRRVREGWAETHLLAFYMMAGPAHVARVRFVELDGGRVAQQIRWRWDAAAGERVRDVSGDAALQAGRRYRVELSFNKPMRHRDAAGAIARIPGAALAPAAVGVALTRDGAADLALDTSTGTWQQAPERVLRYRDDTFAFEFDAPADIANYGLTIATQDYAGTALDADPSTPADWQSGTWRDYENADGVAGDIGGADRISGGFAVAQPASLSVEVVSAPAIVGEGDALRIVLRRTDADVGVRVAAFVDDAAAVEWNDGEFGDKTLVLPIAENTAIDGDRAQSVTVLTSVTPLVVGVPPPAAEPRALPAIPITILDNDSADLAVVRSTSVGASMVEAMTLVTDADAGDSGRAGNTAVVIDGDGVVPWLPRVLAPGTVAEWVVGGALSIYGNHARIEPAAREGASRYLLRVAADGELLVDAVDLRAGTRTLRGFLDNAGISAVTRSVLGHGAYSDPLLLNSGTLRIERSAIVNAYVGNEHSLRQNSGSLTVAASTVADGSTFLLRDGTVDLLATTIVNNPDDPLVVEQDSTARFLFGHLLWQNNGSDWIFPPPPFNCPDTDVPVSLDFNLADKRLCGLVGDNDQPDTELALDAFDTALQAYLPVGSAVDGGATTAEAVEPACRGVDQRGAPRPQTLTDVAEPRCDIGAIELGVNPYRGIWAPQRSGHGIDLQTTGNTLLMAWYTYADDGQPTAYQAAAPLTGRHWQAPLQASRRDAQGVVTVVDVGRVTLDFVSDVEARLGWRFDARGVDGSETIRASLFDDGTPRFEVTGLWFPPGEPNYGATITRRGETTALGLYYYDASGTIRWALGTGDAADAIDFAMTSFSGFCPDCDAAQMPVVGTSAGRVRAHFRTPVRARLDVELAYPGEAGGVWQRTAVPFVSLGDAVDNRAAAEVAAAED